MLQKPLRVHVEKIKDCLIAIRFNISSVKGDGTWMLSSPKWGLQVGIFKHNKGYIVEPHLHIRERYGKCTRL